MTMLISIIAAMDRNRIIGRDNELPWHLPADLRWFKEHTYGKPVVMGRKTYESIGRPLPGRDNIVLTRDRDLELEGCIVVHSVEQALTIADNAEEMMIIGGAQLFGLFISAADRMYLTLIDAEFEGDSHFPAYDASEWIEVRRDEVTRSDDNIYPLQFLILERIVSINKTA
jgi:dihydrofolate reductase